MGSSLILQGGAAVAKTLKESIAQTAHGFTVGSVIRWDGTAATPKYVLALADTATNAEVAGVVNQVDDTDNFQVTYHGYIDIPSLSGVSAPVMFLSSSAGGSLDASPPSAVGTVVKPVLTKNTNGSGYLVMNYLGTQIGGSSTIAVDEIQPVGTIMPYAGTVIPDTWLECNGASYSVSAYPELYAKLQNTSGDRAPIYGYVAKITASAFNTQGTQVGWFIQFKDSTANWNTNQPATGQDLRYDTQADITARIISFTATEAVVEVLPKYEGGKFVYPNVLFKRGAGETFLYNLSSAFGARYRLLNSSGTIVHTNNPVSAVSLEAFEVPDLRGRFAVGTNTSALGELPDNDGANLSAIGGGYTLGALGGEERHSLTTAEMPSHTHGYSVTDPYVHEGAISYSNSSEFNKLSRRSKSGEAVTATNADSLGSNQLDVLSNATLVIDSTGSNTAHNNMPPYLAVRYIIKAKPYTRAAIIDGIDLPYNSLLVRDLRTRNVGGSNGDLVFYTNTSGDSGSGTERMRIYGNGNTGDILFSGAGDSTTTNPLILSVGGNRINSNRDDAYFISTKQDGTTVGYFGFNGYSTQSLKYTAWEVATRGANDSASVTRLYIDQTGNVGIGTGAVSHGATLDVNGTLRVGDFGGNTNVMAKLNNDVSGSNGNIGCAVPLLSYGDYATTTPLPAGTWFVYLMANENDSTGTDEDLSFIMAKVWTVGSGNWLRFKVKGSTPTTTVSGVQYSLGTTSTTVLSSGTWVDLSTTNGNAYYAGSGPSVDTMFGSGSAATHSGTVFMQGNNALAYVHGYAIRIA